VEAFSAENQIEVIPDVPFTECEAEAELDGEFLDLLCETIAADEHKQSKAKEVQQMNRIMDERAKFREREIQKKQTAQMEREVRHGKEENSGIVFKG